MRLSSMYYPHLLKSCLLAPTISMNSFFPSLQNFTSIVGPNGSGKSNVIDSMLFVFGYRARRIRSKKVSVLIHNSEHHQNIQSCSVRVHFQRIVDLVCHSMLIMLNYVGGVRKCEGLKHLRHQVMLDGCVELRER